MPHPLDNLTAEDVVLDALPDEVVASMESRDRWRSVLPSDGNTLEFLINDLQSWTPGQTVRVAFLGGSAELHQKIEEATHPIAEVANLTLSFKTEDGDYRTWTEGDLEYAAEIRVSFDQRGYFSLVGTDSVNLNIGAPGTPIGGHSGQRSLNLSGFDSQLPPTWAGTTRHEFLHALGFQHEHQNMRGPCELAFRWADDPDYQQTKDARGTYVMDAAGRRPGIYTYLSGYPNSWSKAKIDHNLRTDQQSPSTAGPFDAGSVMLYRFPALFYKAQPSPCAPAGDGQQLSEGDKRGLRLLYPHTEEDLQVIADRRETLLNTIRETAPAAAGAEGGPESAIEIPSFHQQAVDTLEASVSDLHG